MQKTIPLKDAAVAAGALRHLRGFAKNVAPHARTHARVTMQFATVCRLLWHWHCTDNAANGRFIYFTRVAYYTYVKVWCDNVVYVNEDFSIYQTSRQLQTVVNIDL